MTAPTFVLERVVCSCGLILAEPPFLGTVAVRVVPDACPECAAKVRAEAAAKAGINALRLEDV